MKMRICKYAAQDGIALQLTAGEPVLKCLFQTFNCTGAVTKYFKGVSYFPQNIAVIGRKCKRSLNIPQRFIPDSFFRYQRCKQGVSLSVLRVHFYRSFNEIYSLLSRLRRFANLSHAFIGLGQVVPYIVILVIKTEGALTSCSGFGKSTL